MIDSISSDTTEIEPVLAQARGEARALNHPYVGAEHLMLALGRDAGSPAGAVLRGMDLNVDELRRLIEEKIGLGTVPVQGDISLSPRVSRLVKWSVEEAKRAHRMRAGSRELLLALIVDGGGIASRLLDDLGIDVVEVQRRLQDTKTP